MLRAEHLSFRIGPKTLIDDVSLTLAPGEFTMVLGPNGAGKSTLLKLLTGTETPQTGQVWYGDQPLNAIPLPTLARQKAVLSQLLSLPFDLNVADVVMMGRYPYFDLNPTQLDTHIADDCLDSVGMLPFQDRAFASLSGGEKQKVHLARVLAQLHRQPARRSTVNTCSSTNPFPHWISTTSTRFWDWYKRWPRRTWWCS